jgi:hypothetical protein
MDDITLNLIVLTVFAVLGLGIFLFVRRKQAEKEQKVIQMAAQYGWDYESIHEPLAWGLRLKSADWSLEAVSRSDGRETSPSSTDIQMSTVWRAAQPGSTLLIGGRTSQANLGSLGESITRQVLHSALGADASGLKEIQFGSTVFRQKYMLWAQDSIEAERLVTPAVQTILLDWKGTPPPLIKRVSGLLSIEIKGKRINNPEEIFSILNLGNLIVEGKDLLHK